MKHATERLRILIVNDQVLVPEALQELIIESEVVVDSDLGSAAERIEMGFMPDLVVLGQHMDSDSEPVFPKNVQLLFEDGKVPFLYCPAPVREEVPTPRSLRRLSVARLAVPQKRLEPQGALLQQVRLKLMEEESHKPANSFFHGVDWAKMFQTTPFGVFLLTPDLELEWANREYFNLTGSPGDDTCVPCRKSMVFSTAGQNEVVECRAQLAQGLPWFGNWSLQPTPEHTQSMRLFVSPMFDSAGEWSAVFGMLMKRDLEVEMRLRHSQKLEAIGLSACCFTHDLNNILGIIVGNASILEDQAEALEKSHRELDRILDAAKRASRITQKYLEFAKGLQAKSKIENLNQIISSFQDLMQQVLGPKIELFITECPDTLPINMGAEQVEQILLNLASNARDAMPTGGVFVVETRRMSRDRTIGTKENDRARDCALLTVSDSGFGIAEEDSSRIYEPFYSTKGKSKGTGLGLFIVHEIVKQLNGDIQVKSVLGKGTSFSVTLPLTNATS